MHLQAQKG